MLAGQKEENTNVWRPICSEILLPKLRHWMLYVSKMCRQGVPLKLREYDLDQTKNCRFSRKNLDLLVDGMQLTKVESERVLGVYIDSHLTWNEHIDTLRRKLLQRIAILARARKDIATKYRLLLYLYNANIKLLFTYCCTVWSNCSQTNLDDLFKLQKRCARFILDSPRDARSYDNFQKLKWLPVDQPFKLTKIGLLKKVIDGKAPEYLIATLDSLRF